MRVAILTRDLPPAICGIGDHSLLFGAALRDHGVEVEWIAGSGATTPGRHIVANFWRKSRQDALLRCIEKLQPDRVVLQYTPLSYAHRAGLQNFALRRLWAVCNRHWRGDLFVHESYFLDLHHPASLLRAPFEILLLRSLMGMSAQVFSASPPIVAESRRWHSGKGIVLPLGSNVPLAGIDRAQARSRAGVDADEIVLTLFGGGNAVRWFHAYVEAVDARARAFGLRIRWVLLGGLKPADFRLEAPVLAPGALPVQALSGFLTLSDILLMPHYGGVSSKRGTLTSALLHGLPVVATSGPATDADCKAIPGLVLTAIPGPAEFAEEVVRLAQDGALRGSLGRANAEHFNAHLRWETIAARYLDAVRIPA